jgi:hypothetical protein
MRTKGIVTSEQIKLFVNKYDDCLNMPTNAYNELSMKGMIISFFSYGSIEKYSYHFEKYILPYQKDMSKKVFEDVYKEMYNSLKNAQIEHAVYTDAEGGTYNNVIYNN